MVDGYETHGRDHFTIYVSQITLHLHRAGVSSISVRREGEKNDLLRALTGTSPEKTVCMCVCVYLCVCLPQPLARL